MYPGAGVGEDDAPVAPAVHLDRGSIRRGFHGVDERGLRANLLDRQHLRSRGTVRAPVG